MSNDFRNVLLMVSAMRSLGNSQLGACFCVRPGHDPVESLLVAVDPQDFSSRLEISPLLHATAKGNLFHLNIGSKTWFNVFGVQTICLMGVQPSHDAGVFDTNY